MKKVLLFNPRAGNAVRIIPNAILAIAAAIEGLTDYALDLGEDYGPSGCPVWLH